MHPAKSRTRGIERICIPLDRESRGSINQVLGEYVSPQVKNPRAQPTRGRENSSIHQLPNVRRVRERIIDQLLSEEEFVATKGEEA